MASKPMTHAIVHFPVDNTVEVVPKSWLLPGEKMCYFPSHTSSSIRKQIRKGEIYSPDWPQFVCKVYKSYGSYADAREFLEEATINSDLSEIEGCTRRTKKAKKPEAGLPSHPAEGQQVAIPGSEGETKDSHPQVEMTQPRIDGQTGGPSNVSNQVAGQPSGPGLVLAGGKNLASTQAQNTGEGQTTTYQLVFGDSMEEFQKDVLLKLKSIEDTQKDHTELLNKILDNMKMTNDAVEEKFMFTPGYFPIKSLEGVGELQTLMNENQSARQELTRLMSSCGGGTVEDAVKLILKMLMTDELLAEHCCKGRSSRKKRFLEYDVVVGAILNSLQGNPRTKLLATMESLEQAISKGLKQAVDRLTQRKLQEARARPNTQTSDPA